MSEFFIYLQLGYNHITDLKGFDHILFIISLCAIYSIIQWKDAIVLVTAFTIGHSATLGLASLNFVHVDSNLIEFLIPGTILITCIVNFFHKFKGSIYREPLKYKIARYLIALSFGLIHGLGFSNYLRNLFGKEDSIIKQLFSFNLGLELGQILIVIIALLFNFLMTSGFNITRKTWNLILSGIVFGMSLILVFERIKTLF
jgi:hypothetical protein